ncbi:MAG: RidA family protein [Salegentibacter sp.]
MIKLTSLDKHLLLLFGATFFLTFTFLSCDQKEKENPQEMEKETVVETKKTEEAEKPDYYLLRPELEKTYGYSHAVKIGNDLKISGAVSMDNEGNLLAEGDMRQQMKNCYSDLEKVLQHYGYSFDDVVVENVYTTDMAKFIEVSSFRDSIYKSQFPTGTWLEVQGLALPGQLIEIDMEAHKSE